VLTVRFSSQYSQSTAILPALNGGLVATGLLTTNFVGPNLHQVLGMLVGLGGLGFESLSFTFDFSLFLIVFRDLFAVEGLADSITKCNAVE
jgi:hypothetical protein